MDDEELENMIKGWEIKYKVRDNINLENMYEDTKIE